MFESIITTWVPSFSNEKTATTWLLQYLREHYSVWLRKESDTWRWYKSVDVRWLWQWWQMIAIEVKVDTRKVHRTEWIIWLLEPHQALDLYTFLMYWADCYIIVYHKKTLAYYIYSLWLDQQKNLELLER